MSETTGMSDAQLAALLAPFHPSSIEQNEDGLYVISGRALEQRLNAATDLRVAVVAASYESHQVRGSTNRDTGEIKDAEEVVATLELKLPGLPGRTGHGAMRWYENADRADTRKGATTAAVRAAANRYGVGLELWPECAGEQWVHWLALLERATSEWEDPAACLAQWEDAATLLMATYHWSALSHEHHQAWQRHWPRVVRAFQRCCDRLGLEIGPLDDENNRRVSIWCEQSGKYLAAFPLPYALPAPPKPIKGFKPTAAKYAGTCFACGEPIAEGDQQMMARIEGKFCVWHPQCLTAESVQEAERSGGRRPRQDDRDRDRDQRREAPPERRQGREERPTGSRQGQGRRQPDWADEARRWRQDVRDCRNPADLEDTVVRFERIGMPDEFGRVVREAIEEARRAFAPPRRPAASQPDPDEDPFAEE